MAKFKSVEEYIQAQPKSTHATLDDVRAAKLVVRRVAPAPHVVVGAAVDARESLSHGDQVERAAFAHGPGQITVIAY